LRYVFELDTTLAFTNPREFEIAETDNSDIVSVGDFTLKNNITGVQEL